LKKNIFMKEQEVYKVWFDPEQGCVRMQWEGYATSAQFRAGTELMYETLVKHGAFKVFGDIKNMVLIGQEDQSWLLHEFLPRAIEAGCRAFALVKPDSYFNKIAVETVNKNIGNDLVQIRMFETREDAFAWLQTIEHPQLKH
jgi:hypothetical protein